MVASLSVSKGNIDATFVCGALRGTTLGTGIHAAIEAVKDARTRLVFPKVIQTGRTLVM
jgi:hypothetical protein